MVIAEWMFIARCTTGGRDEKGEAVSVCFGVRAMHNYDIK